MKKQHDRNKKLALSLGLSLLVSLTALLCFILGGEGLRPQSHRDLSTKPEGFGRSPSIGLQAASKSTLNPETEAQRQQRLASFRKSVEDSLASMKGQGTTVVSRGQAPDQKTIRLPNGIELTEIRFAEGGKIYLPSESKQPQTRKR